MTLNFAKQLPTLGIHYEAIPDPELTHPRAELGPSHNEFEYST